MVFSITGKKDKHMTTITSQVFCTLQIEGIHHWPGCPFDEVAHLRDLHRHMFHIKAYKAVNHDDRDTEFILLKHEIQQHLRRNYYKTHLKCCLFGAMSCEMIARELIDAFGLTRCEVSEDNENGAILTVSR